MDEYISKNELMQYLEPLTNTPAIVIKRYIKDMPVADAQTVKHGRWECVGRDDKIYWYRCSICGHEEHDNMIKHDNYCSKCGARMDLKDGIINEA